MVMATCNISAFRTNHGQVNKLLIVFTSHTDRQNTATSNDLIVEYNNTFKEEYKHRN